LAQSRDLDLKGCEGKGFELEMATYIDMLLCCPFLLEAAAGVADFGR